MINTIHGAELRVNFDLLSLLHQTDHEAEDGKRNHSDKREHYVEEPRSASDEPVLCFVIAVTMARPLVVSL